jgi:hypothetical protein
MIVYATSWSQIGTHFVNLTLSDKQLSNSYFFNVIIFNTPPYFPPGIKPADQRFRLGNPFNYTLPDCQDDNFNPISVELIITKPFVTVKGLVFFFNTKSPLNDLGQYRIKFALTDQHLSTTYDFKMEVFNEAPYFLEPLEDKYVYIG